jgi:hypothetical protein
MWCCYGMGRQLQCGQWCGWHMGDRDAGVGMDAGLGGTAAAVAAGTVVHLDSQLQWPQIRPTMLQHNLNNPSVAHQCVYLRQ